MSTWEDYKGKAKEQGLNVDVNETKGTGSASFATTATGSFNFASSDVQWTITGTTVSGVSEIATGKKDDKITFTGAVNGTNINSGAGDDDVSIKSATDVKVTLGDGNDTLKSEKVVDSNIDATGTGDKTIQIDYLDPSTITLGDGSNTVKITSTIDSTIVGGAKSDTIEIDSILSGSYIDGAAGNDSIVLKGFVKESTVYGGDGNDIVSLSGGGQDALIDLGAGNDTINITKLTTGYTDVSVAGGAGKDVFNIASDASGVTITDFDSTEDMLAVTGGLTAAQVSLSADGTVSLGAGGAQVKVGETNGYYAANVSLTSGTQTFVWGTEDGSLIDASSYTKALIMRGDANNDAVDTLMGGTKADTIYVGKGDYVYGGAGRDSISIAGGTANGTQEFIGLTSNGGKDSIDGFSYGFSDTNDVVYLFNDGIENLRIATVTGGTGMTVKDGDGSLNIQTALTNTNETKLNVMDSSGNITKVDYVTGTATATSDVDDMANVYYSDGSASLNFAAVTDALVVDLDSTGVGGLTNSNNTIYYGKFETITGGSDSTVLIGASANKETLVAGAGDTTLWGGGSKADSLSHGSSSTNSVVYYYGTGDGKDSISGKWGNDDTSDILWLSNDASVAKVKNDGTNTSITLTTGDKVTLTGYGSGSNDEVIKFSNDGANVLQAKVAKSGTAASWTYEEGVNFYIGGKNNTITVGTSVDSAEIWLDNGHGTTYDSVKTINASSNTGTLLIAGTSGNESLVAGKGETTMWGGTGNDTLVGNKAGVTEFYFGKGNGKDVITTSSSDDKVVLFDVALSDVAGATYNSGTMKINLTDGSSLTVNNMGTSSVNTFQLSDGSQWTFDTSSKTWSQKA